MVGRARLEVYAGVQSVVVRQLMSPPGRDGKNNETQQPNRQGDAPDHRKSPLIASWFPATHIRARKADPEQTVLKIHANCRQRRPAIVDRFLGGPCA